MKKGLLLVLLSVLVVSSFASAACNVGVTLLNQDPYPATPGEYVRVVFQITGAETTECNEIFLDVVPEYPFTVEDSETRFVVPGGTYLTGYESFVLKGYKLRVDENALDGDNKLKIEYGFDSSGSSVLTKEFDINVEDSRTDFDVSVQSYDAEKNTVTFGIINIGKYDAESLTLEIPEQDNLVTKGSTVAIIGSLNSNDDTTSSIEAVPKAGEVIVKLSYNDKNDVRRTVEKTAYISKSLIENGAATAQPRGGYFYLFWIVIVILVIYMIYRYRKNKNAKNNKLALLKR